MASRNEYNFDHPEAFDFELLVTVLRKLKKGKSVKVPVYDFTSHCRRKDWVSAARVCVGRGVHPKLHTATDTHRHQTLHPVGMMCVFSLQKTVYGANVVIFEGILAFANKELLKVGETWSVLPGG